MFFEPVERAGHRSWPGPQDDDDRWCAADEELRMDELRSQLVLNPSPQPKRNHHYIPEFWLRQFSAPGRGGTRVVGQLDRTTGSYRELPTKRVAAVEALYDSPALAGVMGDSVENLFGIIEGKAAPVMERLRTGRRPAPAGRMAFATFLVMQGLRIPRHVENAGRADVTAWHDTVEEMLRVAETHGYDPEATARLRGYHDAGMSLDVAHMLHYADFAELSVTSAARLYRRRWSLAVCSGRPPLLLADDDPVPAVPLGRCVREGDDAYEFFPSLVPLSPRHLLAIHEEPDDGSLEHEDATEAERLAFFSNAWQYKASQRYLLEDPSQGGELRTGARTDLSRGGRR